MLGPDGVRRRVEIDEVTRPDVDGADAQARPAGIETIKIDQTLQRALEIPGVVEARGFDRSARLKPRDHRARGKKAFDSVGDRNACTQLVEQIARAIAPR